MTAPVGRFPAPRSVDLLAAEVHRALLGPQTRRTVGAAVLAMAVAVATAAVQRRTPTVGDVRDTLDGIRSAMPLVGALLGALAAGSWAGSGTAALVAAWAPRRARLAATELLAVATVVAGAGLAVWALAVVLFGGHAVVAGTPAGAVLALGTGGAVPVAASVGAGALVGASLGLACRSSAGGVLVLVGTYLFAEPLVRAGLTPSMGPNVEWLAPVSALVRASGTATTFMGAGPAPWPIASIWAAALAAVATALFRHRDLL